MGNLQNFQTATRLEVAVDGIIFASGQFVGADELHEYEEWQAKINEPRDVATRLLKNQQNNVPTGETVTWLQTLTTGRGTTVDVITRERARIARFMLNAYTNRGEERLYATAQGILNEQPFPLHR